MAASPTRRPSTGSSARTSRCRGAPCRRCATTGTPRSPAGPRPWRSDGDCVGHLTYLALLAGCLVVTAPLELVLRVRVYARWRRLLVAVAPEFAVFVVWVLYAIAQGHWDYSDRLTLGVRLPGGIPVEEVLFFLVVPLCSVLALEAVRKVTGWDAGYPAEEAEVGR